MNEQILLLSTLIANNLCITLDATTGICLSNVASYQPGDVAEMKGGEPTGKVETKPCVFFVGGDSLPLSDEQNKNFRLYWDAMAKATNLYFGLLNQLSNQPAPPPAPQIPA